MFLTDNQAGTTATLLIGALFILMAVQGTAVRRAAKDSLEMHDREEAVERVTETAKDALDGGDPEAARAVIAGATAARPDIRADPTLLRVEHVAYEREVYRALLRVIEEIMDHKTTVMANVNFGQKFDAAISSILQPTKPVLIKALHSLAERASAQRVMAAKNRIRSTGCPGMIVSNRYMTQAAISGAGFDRGETDVQFVLWQGSEDDEALAIALRRLMPEASNSGSTQRPGRET